MFRIGSNFPMYFHLFLGTHLSGPIFQKFLKFAFKPIQSPGLNNIDDCCMRH